MRSFNMRMTSAGEPSVFFKPESFSRKDFSVMNDDLLPIHLSKSQYKYQNLEKIIWFSVNDNLFKNLPARYQYLKPVYDKLIRHKEHAYQFDVVKYEVPQITESLNLVHLKHSELQKLGYSLKKDTLGFSNGGLTILINASGYKTVVAKTKTIENRDTIDKIISKTGIELKYLTNNYGEPTLIWDNNSSKSTKEEFGSFMQETEFLVPILVKTEDYADIFKEDQIFWFKPTEALFDSLPPAIGEKMKLEYHLVSSGNSDEMKSAESTCTYSETCKSTLPVADLMVYPNPARQSVNINFELFAESRGNISLVNISGAILQVLVSERTFREGPNSFTAELSSVSPGIYLIMIQTEKGFKTQRLIISR